jgi:hypothetical protein
MADWWLLCHSGGSPRSPINEENCPLPEDVYLKVTGDMISELERVLKAEALVAAVALTYVFMDAMTKLSLEIGRDQVKATDFEAWVTKYMRTPEPTEYQYSALDLYHARCSMLHTYSPQLGRPDKRQPKTVGYHDGAVHRYNPTIDANLILLSVPQLVDDFYDAIEAFFTDALKDANLKARINARITGLFQHLPFPSGGR